MFSVIIPLYNKKQFVSRTIDSVLNQSIQNFEIIVVDDGSSDQGGEMVLSAYSSKLKYIYQENQGVSAARNTGIRNANFAYLAFLDADDYWHVDYLFWMARVIERYPKAGMLGSTYSNTALPTEIKNPPISEIEDYYHRAVSNTLFTSSSTVIHRDFFKQNEGFKSQLTTGEDIDVWLRAFAWFGKGYYVHAPLMHYDLDASDSLKTNPNLKRTIFSEMFKSDYPISNQDPSWIMFREKYLILNLFQYFDTAANFSIGQNLLSQRIHSYSLSQIPYLLPFSFFKRALKQSRIKKLIRNYLKFCFRYLYK